MVIFRYVSLYQDYNLLNFFSSSLLYLYDNRTIFLPLLQPISKIDLKFNRLFLYMSCLDTNIILWKIVLLHRYYNHKYESLGIKIQAFLIFFLVNISFNNLVCVNFLVREFISRQGNYQVFL